MPLNLPRAVTPRFYAVNPTTGRPVSLGTVEWMNAGTTERKDVYVDREGANVAVNPTPLDAAGACDVFLSGSYRVEVRDANGATVYTADQINSIPVELPEGNPGSFIIANNLSEGDPPSMRGVLELVKQTGAFEATSGRVLLVGAGGLLGHAGSIASPSHLDTVRNTSWRRVATGDVTAVGGPSGAPAGLVEVIALDGENVLQIYHPMTGASTAPWRRRCVSNVWSAWDRDYETGSGTPVMGGGAFGSLGPSATYRWTKRADGSLSIIQTGVNFVFTSTTRLAFSWVLPAGMPQFLVAPHVTMTAPPGISDLVSIGSFEAGIFAANGGNSGSAVEARIWRGELDRTFEADDQVLSCTLMASGWWR